MKSIKYLLTLALCFCCAVAFAQKRITGHVWSSTDKGPVIMANVAEIDKSNRAVSATQTDASGNFSLTIKNPNNTLQVSYIGYRTVRQAIGTQTNFRIELVDNSTFSEAVKTVTRKTKSNGMVIPEREISVAQQSLNMDEMQGLSFETAGEALQGQIAGLDIVSNSGNLGSGTSMRLRGVTTINGDQNPLIVVDGDILEDYDTDEFDANDMNEEKFASLLQVNPEDIQSINVLKDAAATAIWGSRGSNGVIEIKTRRGARGKTRVNFSYRFSGSWQPEGMKMLTGDEYKIFLQQAYHNPNPEAGNPADQIVELQDLPTYTAYRYNYNKNTDWIDEVTQFGQTHNYSVSLSGGGDKATFRVSASYDHEIGTVIKQTLDRFTTRLALDYYVSDRIKFSSNFSLVYTNQNKNYDDGLMGYAYKAMPNMSVTRWEYNREEGRYFDTGEYYLMPKAATTTGMVSNTSNLSSYYLSDMVTNGNPVAIAEYAWRKWSTYTITPKFSVEYKFLGKEDNETQLNYTGEVYINAYTETKNSYYPHNLETWKMWSDQIDRTSNNEYKNFTFKNKHSLLFKPAFSDERHALQVLASIESTASTSTNQYLSSSGISGGITDPTAPGYLTGLGTSTGKSHTMALTGSAHYAFNEKYSLTLTLRGDGSTKFGDGHKWGFFPGVSARWNISDEPFFEPLKKVVSMLAFRPGYGITGLANFGEGLIYNQYGTYNSYNGTTAMKPTNLRLTNIRWEKTKSWNLGFNLNFFEDLIKFDLNIYHKYTTDLINSSVSVPSTSGYTSLSAANVGKMENEGWELYVNTRELFKVGKFSTVFRFNFAQNINTVTEMDASVLAANNSDFDYSGGNEQVLKRVQIGHALGGIYGFRYKGVYAYDYKHNGYFIDDTKNEFYMSEPNADGTYSRNTAAATGKTAPIVRDSKGNVVYDKNGNPLQMVYNYGGINHKFEGGDVIYEDVNYDGQIDELDIVYLGSSNPKVSGGFGIDFNYGRWTLKTNFNFRIGNKIINLARMYAEDMRTNKNQSAAVNHRWRTNGQETEIPRALSTKVSGGANYNALISDRYVEKGDYLRFQYFQIGYSFPSEKLKRYGISSLRLNASGNNLIFWTKYKGTDPDHSQYGFNPCTDSSQTPRSRSFTLSLNIGF